MEPFERGHLRPASPDEGEAGAGGEIGAKRASAVVREANLAPITRRRGPVQLGECHGQPGEGSVGEIDDRSP